MSSQSLRHTLDPRIVARLYAGGRSVREIANECNVSQASVRSLLKSPAFQQLVSLFRAALRRQDPPDRASLSSSLTQLVPVAVLTIEDIINDPLAPHSTRLEAAKTVLDRAGFPPHQRVSVSNTSAISDDDLNRIRIRAREIVYSIPTGIFETGERNNTNHNTCKTDSEEIEYVQ